MICSMCECGEKHLVPRIPYYGQLEPKVLCPECDRQKKLQKQQDQQRQRHDRTEAQWKIICPPLYRATDPSRLPQDALAKAMAWRYGPQGLLLVGPTGGGKTRAAYVLLRRLLEEGLKIVAFDCAGFGHEVGRRFRDGTGEDWVDGLAGVDIVFLDDLGKIPFTERAEAELFSLIERRTANEVPIIATTNMIGTDLEAKASQDRGAPMVRRLREFCKVILFPQALGENVE